MFFYYLSVNLVFFFVVFISLVTKWAQYKRITDNWGRISIVYVCGKIGSKCLGIVKQELWCFRNVNSKVFFTVYYNLNEIII